MFIATVWALITVAPSDPNINAAPENILNSTNTPNPIGTPNFSASFVVSVLGQENFENNCIIYGSKKKIIINNPWLPNKKTFLEVFDKNSYYKRFIETDLSVYANQIKNVSNKFLNISNVSSNLFDLSKAIKNMKLLDHWIKNI